MSERLFGTDGLRGRVNTYPLTAEMALRLGLAAGTVFRSEECRRKVIIGKDTRLSGYMFESALTAGLCAAGMDVYQVGPLPTPAIAFLTRNMRADFGVVISASHNPYHDNGIKFFDREGLDMRYRFKDTKKVDGYDYAMLVKFKHMPSVESQKFDFELDTTNYPAGNYRIAVEIRLVDRTTGKTSYPSVFIPLTVK